MTFKYSVLLKARFGGPFVLSENTRLLLYMPKWRFQSILCCFLAYPHATCRKNECVKYIAFPYIADTLWKALLSPLYRVLFHTFHRVFHIAILQNYAYLYTASFCDCVVICSRIVDTAVYICRNMSAIGDTYVVVKKSRHEKYLFLICFFKSRHEEYFCRSCFFKSGHGQ